MEIIGETPNLEGYVKDIDNAIAELRKTRAFDDVKSLLQLLRTVPLSGLEEGIEEAFYKCITLLCETITDDNFSLDRDQCFKLLEYGALIANVAKSCRLSTTKHYLEKTDSLHKRLLLTNARSEKESIEDIIKEYKNDIPLFNNWACNVYQVCSGGFIDKAVNENLDIVAKAVIDNEFIWGLAVGDLFNCVTYMDSKFEKAVRKHICSSFKKTFGVNSTFRQASRKRIAVYSENWFEGHSTHRTVAKYIEPLKDKYDLVLLHGERYNSAPNDKKSKVDIFKEKHKIGIFGVFNPLEMAIVGPQDFSADMMIFPDAGFDVLSVILANMRLAPVQISMTGFPISLFNGEIDYFISGEAVEKIESLDKNYSEKVVLLPGFGAIHTRPPFEPAPQKSENLIVAGSWIGPKTHHYLTDALSTIFKNTTKKCVFRIFPGISWFYNNKAYLPYVEKMQEQFENNLRLEVVEGAEPPDYIRLLSEANCALDSYPWGGSNTVSDCIHTNTPVIVWEGDRWYNRIGPAMLRSLGLYDLIATSSNDYIDKSIRIIEDNSFRDEMHHRLIDANASGLVDDVIYDSRSGEKAFVEFIDSLLS